MNAQDLTLLFCVLLNVATIGVSMLALKSQRKATQTWKDLAYESSTRNIQLYDEIAELQCASHDLNARYLEFRDAYHAIADQRMKSLLNAAGKRAEWS